MTDVKTQRENFKRPTNQPILFCYLIQEYTFTKALKKRKKPQRKINEAETIDSTKSQNEMNKVKKKNDRFFIEWRAI